MDVNENRVTTDILVVGGGFAGVFAAVRAGELGLDVTLVDKGSVGRSGQTPWADSFHVFDETKGADREEFQYEVARRGDYLNNRGFLDMLMDDSKDIFDELKSWGAVGKAKFGRILDKKIRRMGIRVIKRTMLTHFIKEQGRVIGAMGFPLDQENEVVIIHAKAVINCAGAGCYKSHGYPIQGLTFDGDAMSYAVGAEISGKEFNDFHETCDEHPGSCWFTWGGKWGAGLYEENHLMPGNHVGHHLGKLMNVKNGQLPMTPPKERAAQMVENKQKMMGYSRDQKVPMGPPVPPAPEGAIPPNSPEVKLVSPDDPIAITRGGAAAGMSLHKGEGVFPKDGEATFESCVEGLFAAGDSLASMLGGTQYPGLGFSSSASCVQGARAGIQAADYVKHVAHMPIDEATIEINKQAIFAPRNRDKGYEPHWVIQQLQNTMIPFYVLHIKEEQRLSNALHTIRYLSNNLAPKMRATDCHELKLVHEAKNMLLNAEMRLQASMFRKESRGSHYREDYPEINSEEWTAWVVISRSEDGAMQLRKHPVPQPAFA